MGKESTQEQVLRASKEIAVKFIEVGRLSPSNFAEAFKNIYDAIDATVKGAPVNVTTSGINSEKS
ncbi:MAG: conjugal transfer protein TraB [Desulfobacteraceae bacterium]|nr:conjugal transfer protein TraB [Desulfobacteraceae bacterium]